MKNSTLYPRLRATAAALALALVAAGCAVGPDYQKPQSAPVTLASPEQALFSNGQLQRDWWKQLQDPQLDRLIGLALERNHDIRIAQARLAESRAVLDEKELDQLPTVTAGGRYERSLSQANPGPEGERNLARSYRAGFDASWEIDLFGRLRRAAEGAAARSQAQAADLAQARIVVAAEVARNYFELRGAEQRLAVARANLRSQEDSLRVIQAMVSAGRGDEGDLASARAELATVQASVPQQAAARRLAQYRIAVLAGLRPAELGELDAARPQAPLAAACRSATSARCCRGDPTCWRPSATWPPPMPTWAWRPPSCIRASTWAASSVSWRCAAPTSAMPPAAPSACRPASAGRRCTCPRRWRASARPRPAQRARSRVTSRPCCARWRSWRPP